MDRPTNERHDWAARTNGLPTAEAAERRHADLRCDSPAVKGLLIHCSVASYRDKRQCLQGSMMRARQV